MGSEAIFVVKHYVRGYFEENVLSNLKQMVVPHIEKLKESALDAEQMGHVNMLQSNLNDIISPFLLYITSLIGTEFAENGYK